MGLTKHIIMQRYEKNITNTNRIQKITYFVPIEDHREVQNHGMVIYKLSKY